MALLNGFREREGAATAGGDAAALPATSATWWRGWKRSAPGRCRLSRSGLRERLADLLRGAAIEPQRLAQEAAILADRSDIARNWCGCGPMPRNWKSMLDGHGRNRQAAGFPAAGNEPRRPIRFCRKPAGWANSGLTITDLALAAKAEIDKIREQALNLE